MKNTGNKSEAAVLLRPKAEELQKKKISKSGLKLSEAEILKLIHELEVHQIQLEMQNQEIMLAKNKADVAAEKYTELYDFAPSGYFTFSDDGKIIELNLSGSQMLGKERSKLRNSKFGFFVSDDTKSIFNLFLAKLFNSKDKQSCEVVLSANGSLPMYVQLTGMVTENGEQCLVTAVDITERKKAETEIKKLNEELEQRVIERTAELKKSNERFFKVFDNNSIGMIITNLETTRFEYVNKAFIANFGYAEEEVIGKTSRELNLIELESRDEILSMLKQAGDVQDIEIAVRKKNGEIFTSLTSVQVIIIDDQKLAVTSFRDITQRKKAEEKLKQSNESLLQEIEKRKITEQALREEKEKEQFLANMSHEIRTPMNAIIGFTDVLEKTKLSINQQQYIHAIKTSGENLLAIINDILDYSKIEEGIIRFEKVAICIHQMFDSLRVMMAVKAQAKGIDLIFKSDDNVPDAVIGDPMRLTQIILNLVSNAIKFTEKGSVIVNSKIKEERGDVVILEFEVSDTGIGIPADKLKTIFKRFQQADSDTARHYGGTGLGLSIAKNLVKLQGGTISVASEWAKGSVFTFTMPFQKASEKEEKEWRKRKKKKKAETESKKFDNLKVLLAEDNKMNQKLMSVVLADMGIEADLAENGKIAVEKLEKNNYDFILMDMQMPEMDGYDATLYIRGKLKYSIPIIAMTAHALPGEKEKCLALGMNEYISKPFKAEKLYNIISSVLQTDASVENETNREKTDAAGSEKQVIDIKFLKELSNNNINFVREILEIFVDEVPAEITLIDEAIEKGDYAVIKKFSHKLNSSVQSLNMGEEFEQILSAIEDKATSGNDIAGIKKLLSQFEPMVIMATKQAQNELLKLV